MSAQINISDLAKKVEEMIQSVRNGAASTYFKFTVNEDTDNEEDVTIRISNHGANPQRVNGKSIIFVIPDANTDIEREDGDVTSFCINKKSFAHVAGTYSLNENNCDENGNDIEYLLDYELN